MDPRIAEEFIRLRDTMTADGSLPSGEKLRSYYDTFRRKFGPEALRSLEGEQLLDHMHAHGSRDSLVYWLEFKNDDEFPAMFGSIGGGSAFKFGVFKRKETGVWATKGGGPSGRDISVAEAVEIAERHRAQLLAAVDAIGVVQPGADDDRYAALQARLEEVAPDVQDLSWVHKYLSLIFPDVLDDFHATAYQQYHLIRTLVLPPRWEKGWKAGRYVSAGRFVALASELEMPLNHLTSLMVRRNDQPKNYWRVGAMQDGADRRAFWPLMRDGSFAGMGWPDVGDLSEHTKQEAESVAARVHERYGVDEKEATQVVKSMLRFALDPSEGDRVLVSDGKMVLGVGEIVGPYRFDPTAPLAHQRDVKWVSLKEWTAATADPLKTRLASVHDLRDHLETERRILEDAATTVLPPPVTGARATETWPRTRAMPRLQGKAGVVQAVLERKGQAILYGPPGTGKTYWAIQTAQDLAAYRAYATWYRDLEKDQQQRIVNGTDEEPALVRTCTFHPEYGYEDFLEGYRPQTNDDGQLVFTLRRGVFRRLCDDAVRSPGLDFYLVVDEINRGDVPRIFGELLTLLERDKRGQPVVLPASGEVFRIPPNIFVIGTMNTADRSIALLDVALRRRFGFVELMPDYETLGRAAVGGLPLGAWLEDLNSRIRATGGGDARNRQVGHAFLLDRNGPIKTLEQLTAVLRDDIVPLLEEFCYDDYEQLAELLGSTLVDLSGQRIRREYFEAGRATDLIGALMRPEIATAIAAVVTDEEAAEEEAAESEDDGEETEGEVDAMGSASAPE